MEDVVIRAEKLGKLYRIGQRHQYATLRDLIVHSLSAPFRWFNRNHQSSNLNSQSHSFIWALKDVSFEVKRGEVIGIIGRNGAGKSTLLKILARITEPTEGYAEVRGRVGSLLEVGTGFHPELTGRENIYLSGAVLGMKKREIDKKFDEIVAFAEMEKFIDTPVKYYSSGMYVRLAFAVAAHLDPEILLVDEVLAVGDAAFQKKCLGKMGDVAKEGRTVLFVSHNMAAIENLCSKAIVLEEGHIIYFGNVQKAITTYLQMAQNNISKDEVKRTNRRGNGKVRLVDFWVEVAGERRSVIRCGEDVEFVFKYDSQDPKRLKNVVLYFAFHDAFTHQMLTVLSNRHVGQLTQPLPPKGELRCLIRRFPLAPGRYIVSPRLDVNNEVADWLMLPEGIGMIDVEVGDFYGTGVSVGIGGFAPFLTLGEWSVKGE